MSVEELPPLRKLLIQKRNKVDGHIVIYEPDLVAGTVNVHHVYHTKQDISGRLGVDENQSEGAD